MFGSHLSVAGGLVNALHDAQRLALDTVQIFTKNQRQWASKPLEPGAAHDWLDTQRAMGWADRTVAHDSYLINLASPDDALWERSIDSMRDEIDRCATLSIPFLVSHPGAHLGTGVEAGIARIAAAYKRLLKDTRGLPVCICLECTAGGGSTMGRTFEELAALRRAILDTAGSDAEVDGLPGPGRSRIGFCIDTCHALSAGYDLAATQTGAAGGPPVDFDTARRRARAVIDKLDEVCGIEHVRALHLNDSKGARGSHIDRHEHIGRGLVALGAFAAFVGHPSFAGIPKIMETPKEPAADGRDMDSVNVAVLRALVRGDEGAARAAMVEAAPGRAVKAAAGGRKVGSSVGVRGTKARAKKVSARPAASRVAKKTSKKKAKKRVGGRRTSRG